MTACTEWTGPKNLKGYGRQGKKLAHRVAWERAKGPVPANLELDHLCRNRACVNVEHLELVTHQENCRRGEQAQKTHCANSHLFDEANTRIRSNGWRSCRQCHNQQRRAA
jgi:hypothetical protein